MPELHWKVDFGHILTVLVLIAGLAVTWGATSAKLEANAAALTEIKVQMQCLQDRVNLIRDEQVRNTTILNMRNAAEDVRRANGGK